MGRLSPFRSSITLGIALFILTVLTPNHAAPVQDSAISSQVDGKGCYFMNKHYPSGHEIDTNEPCLNCTCVESTLMCYLRVCPFIKPVGENCVSEMHVGDCCPKYWCPEVYPRITTEAPEIEAKGCYLDGRYYMEGDRLPMNPVKPCEACYCIRNTSVCTMQTCELSIDGCFPQYKVGSCCPARYNCTDDAATTIPPGVMDAEHYEGCLHEGKMYKDGERVPSEVKCNQCYCMKHSVVCAVASCKAPAENCVPHETPDGQCCPEKYDCPEGTEIPDSATTHMITTEEEFLNLTTLYKTPSTLTTASVSASAADEDLTSGVEAESFSTTELESLYPTTKGIRRIDDVDLVSTLSTIDEMMSTEDELSKTTEKTITPVPRVTTRRPVFFPSRPIPGEGVCRHHNKTYQNGEKFESDDPCLKNCTCVNSVVKCDKLECVLEPPKAGINCKVKSPEECCPVYVCDVPLSPPSPEETEDTQQQEILDSLATTPKTEQQEIIPDSESTTRETEVQEVTITQDIDQQTVVDALVTTIGTKELDQTTIPDSTASTSTTEVSITDVHSLSTETDGLSKETTTTSDEIITKSDLSQETVSDKATVTKLETTLAVGTVTPLIITSTTEVSVTATHPESTQTDVPLTETTIVSEEVFTEADHSQEIATEKTTVTKLETTLDAETVTPLTTLSSATEIAITSTYSTPTQSEVSHKETTVVGDEISTKTEQPETDETKFEESLAPETGTPLTTEESVTHKMTTTIDDGKTKITFEDEIATTPLKTADKDIPITDEELKTDFSTTIGKDSITKEILSTKTIPEEISTESADTSRTVATTTVMPEADKDATKKTETTTISLGDTSDEVSSTTVTTGLELTTIFKKETTSDIIQTAVTKEKEADTTLLQTEEAYSTSTEGELKLDQSAVIDEESTTKLTALLSTESEQISTERIDTKPTIATTTVEEKKDIDVSKDSDITTSLADKFDKASSTTEATDLTSTIVKETTTVIPQTIVAEEKETSATHLQTDEGAITSTEEGLKLDLSTVVEEDSTTKYTILPGEISTERPDTAKPTATMVEEKDASVTKETEITTSISDKSDVVSSTTEAIVSESTAFESETSIDTLQTTVTEERVSDKLTTPEKEVTTLSEITTEGEIRKTTFELEADTTEKTTITFEPQTSTEVKEDITSMLTTKISSDVTSDTFGSKDTETVTQEIPVTQEAEKVTSISEIVPVTETEIETFPTEDVKKVTLEQEIITTEFPRKGTSKPEDLLKDITSKTSYSEILTTEEIELTTKFETPVKEFKTTLKPITIKTEETETISPVTDEEGRTSGSETSVTEEKRIVTKEGDVSSAEVTTTSRISEPTIAFTVATTSETLESETEPSDVTTESEDKKSDTSDTSLDHEETEKSTSEVDTTTVTSVISMKPTLGTDKTETEATEVTKFTSPEITETTGTVKPSTVISEVTKLLIITPKAETEKDESSETLETDKAETTSSRDQTTSISKTSPFDTTQEQTESEMAFETSEVPDRTDDTLKKSTFAQEFTDKLTTKFEWSSPVFSTITSTSVPSHSTEELFEMTDMGTTLFDGEEKDEDRVKTTESKDETEITPSDITSSKLSTESTTQSHAFVTKEKAIVTTEKPKEKVTFTTMEEISKDLTELKTTLSDFETSKEETVSEIIPAKTDKTDLPMDTKAVELSTLVTEAPDLVTTISVKTEVTESAAPEIEVTKKADVSTESAVSLSVTTPTGETDVVTPTVVTELTSEKTSSLQDTEVSTIVKKTDMDDKAQETFKTETTKVFLSTPSQEQTDLVTLTEGITEETTSIGTKQETSDLDKFETDSLEGVTEVVSKQAQDTTTKLEGEDFKTTPSAAVSETSKVMTTEKEVFLTHSFTEEITTVSKLETITPESEISSSSPLPLTSTPKPEDLDSEISTATEITKISETTDVITDALSPVHGVEATTSETSLITEYQESTRKSDTEKTEIMTTEKSITSEIVPTVSETDTTFPTSVDTEISVPSEATTEKLESDFTQSTEGVKISSATEMTDKTSEESDKEVDLQPETMPTTEKVKPEEGEIALTVLEGEKAILTSTVSKLPFTTASHPSTEISSSTVKITEEPTTVSITTSAPSDDTADAMTTVKITEASFTETGDLESKTTIKFDTEKPSAISKDTTVESQSPKDGVVTVTLSTLKDLEEKDVATSTSYDISETSDHTVSTLETEIITDNVFTPIKHLPDSLIREKSTIPETKTDTITSSPMSEITETIYLTDTPKTSPDITQKAETASTMEFSKTESGLERSTTQDTQHETVTEKASSEIPSEVELTVTSEADEISKDKTISVPDITTVITVGTLDDREIKTTGPVPSDVSTKATVSSISLSETSTTERSHESAETTEKSDRTTVSVELSTDIQETGKDERLTVTDTGIQKETLPVSKEISTEVPTKVTDFTSSTKIGVTSATEKDTTATTSEEDKTDVKITEETSKRTTTKMFSTEATEEDKFTTETLSQESSTKDSDLMFSKQTEGLPSAAVTDSETEILTTYKYDEVSTKSTSLEIDKKVKETTSESVLTTLSTVTIPESFETESEMMVTKSEVPSESEETDMTSDRDSFEISSVSAQETKTPVLITTTEVLSGETTTIPSKKTETEEVSTFTSEKMDVTDTSKIEATTDKISTTVSSITEDQENIFSTKETITAESSVMSETEPTIERKTLSQTTGSEIITTESSPPSHSTENITFDEKLETTKIETQTPESLLVTNIVTLPEITYSTIASSGIEEISTSIPLFEERKTTLPPVDSHVSTVETISLDAETSNDTSEADIVTTSVPSDFTTSLTSDLDEKTEISTHIDLKRNLTESTIIVSTIDLHDLTTEHTTKVQTIFTGEDATTAGQISVTAVEGADDTDIASSTPVSQEDAKSTATFEAEPVSTIKPFSTEVEDHLTTITEIGKETKESTPKSDTVSDHLLFETTRQSESSTEESVKSSPTDIKLTTVLDKEISISESVSPEITELPITSDIPKDFDKESTTAVKEILKESTTAEKDLTHIFSLETETVTMESEGSSTKEMITTEEMPIITSPIPELETGKVSTEKTAVTEAELIDKISLTTDEEDSTVIFETEQTSEKTDMKTSTKMSSETEIAEKIDTSVSTTTEKPTESEKLSTQAMEITTPEPKVITDFVKEFTSVSSVSEKELTTISEEFDDSKKTTFTSEERSTTLLSSTPAFTDLNKSVTEMAATEKETVVSSEPSTLSTSKERVEVTTGTSLKESTTTERVTVDVEEKAFTETSAFTERFETTTIKKSTETEEETPETGETTEIHVVSSTVSVPAMTEKVPEIFSTVQSTEETGTEEKESEKEISATEDALSTESTLKFDKTSGLPEISTIGTSKTPDKTEILLTDVTSQDIAKITTVAAKDESTTGVTSTTKIDFKISDTTLPEKELGQTEEPKVSLGTEISEISTQKETDLPRDSLETTVTETTLKDSKLETTPSLELQTSTSLTSEFTTKQLLKSDTSPEIPEVSTKPVTVPETVDLKTLSERTETSTALSELEDKTSTLESVTDIKKSTTITFDEITTSSSIELDLSSEKEISSTTDKTEDRTEFMTKSDVESTEVKASTDEFIKTSIDVISTPPEKDITVIPLSESDKTTDESEKKVITTESTTFDLGLKVTKLSTVDKTETASRDDEKTKSTPSSTTTEFLETITDEYDVIKETTDIDKENVTVTISEAEEITEKDFMSTTSKISDMVTKDELRQSTYTTLKYITSTEETVGITTLKSFETTEKKLIDLTDKTPEVYSSSEITPTDGSTTDKVSGTESEVFTTKTTEFVPNITDVVRETDAETDVSYTIAHSLSTMKPAQKTEVTTEVSDADTTSVTLKVKTTELSDINETKVVAETTEKVSTQTSVSGEDITVTKPTAEEEITTLPTETESPVDDGARTDIPSRWQTTKKMPLPDEVSTVASRSSEKPLISTPFVAITSLEEEITTKREIFTVEVETTTEHTVVTEETALKNATFGVDSMIITSSTTEPSVTSFIGNDTEEESFTRDDLTESSLKITTHPSTSVPKTDIPEDLVSDVTFKSKTTSSEMVDAETVQTVSTLITSTKISVDTEKQATVEESLQTSPVSEKTTTRIPPVSEFSSLSSEMAVDTVTEKISSLEPEEKITTMQSTDASDTYSDSELPEGFFSRRDEKIDTITTEVSEIPTESDIFTSTVSEEFKTTLKTKEVIEDISTTKLIKTETKATTSIEVDEFTAKDTEMTPEISVTFKFTTEPVTDRIIETDITKDSEATTLGAGEETTLFERKGTTISSDTSSSQATFDVTEEVFTTIQTDKIVDEQDIKSSEIPKEVTMIETEETPEGPTPSPDIRISTASHVADDSITKITKYMSPITQASETTTVSVEGETEYPTKTIFTTDGTEVKETRLDASETTEIEELKTSTFAVLTKEYPVATESPPSRATMVPSEVITDGTTPEKSISTDTERKDFTSETKALSEVETSTEGKFDILSTTLSPEIPKTEVDSTFDMKDDCMVNGTSYKDGEAIITIDPCEKCHCSLGEIRCFKILCKLPKEGCKPNISSTSECCPSSYECPEEDISIPSTTTMHSVSHKDLTTPIPISFMFSTTPKSIASTMLITKSDDLTESTEETTSEKLETILSKDMTSTLVDVSPKVTEETVSEEVITDSSTVRSTPETSDLYPSSTGPSAETVTLSVISKQDNQTTDKDVEATKAIAQEISTTLRGDLIGETATVTSSAGVEVTSTEIPTSRIYLTSTDGKEKISEVTKQTTETPTTFDTIKTTFEVTQEEKEGETTLVPSSTTTPYSTTMESNLTTAFETVSSTGIVFEDKVTEKAETMLPVTVRESKTTEKAITEQDKMTTQMLGETTTVRVEVSSDKEGTGTLSDFTKEIILEKMSTTIAPKIIEETGPTEIITIKENLTTTTPTAMPSKLPKLDDILTSTMETRSETLSTIFSEDKGTKEVTKTDVTERKTTTEESTVSSFETTDSKVTLKDSDVKVSTESGAAVTEGVSSTKTSFVYEDATTITLSSEDVSTSERINKTTEEELLSTLFGSPTKEPTSFDISTVTKSNLLSETTDSLMTSSLFDTKQDTLPTETVSTPEKVLGVTHKELGKEDKYFTDKDKFDTTSSTLPTFASIPEETTEFEIITEISLMNKTIPSLDKEGTERSTEKEILTSTISIPVTHTDETIINKTTDFEEETEKVGTASTLSDFTDKIFTFVSTRFTDLTKGTEEFTTFPPQKDIEGISKKQTTVITTSEFSTEKADKSVTPFIPLTRRIDLEIDRTTLEGSTLQDAEITQSPLFEQTTRKELVTKPKDESTSDTVGSATTDEATFKSTETEDILTTISSIITSLKQDTVTSSSLSEKPVTSTMQDAFSETTKETSSTEDEDKFRTTEKSRVELTTIPDSAMSSTKAQTKDADVSPTGITQEFDMETLKVVSTFKEESDVSTPEPEIQPISVTTESEEEVSDYTKIPSRATRKDVRFETTPTSFTGTEEQETKATDQPKDITRVDDDQSTTKQVIATTTPFALSSTSESSTPSPIKTISDKFDLPTLSTLFSILTNESTEKTDLETNETSSTPFEEKPVDILKTTTTDEDDESSRDIEEKLTTAGQDTETASPTVTREEIFTVGETTRTTEKETFTESTKHLESTTRIDEKIASPDEVSITGKGDTISEIFVTSEISETTVKEVTQEIIEQTKSTSDTEELATVSLSPKIETTEFEDNQITQKVENITDEMFTTESSKITEKETGKTESIEQTKTTVSVGENITEPSEVTVKLEAETLSVVITTTEIPKMTEAEARTESTEQSELTPTVSEKTTLTTQLDKDVTTAESDTSTVPQITQTVRGETPTTSDIPMTTEIRDRTESTELPIPTQKIHEKTEEPTVVTRKAETASETVLTVSETPKMTEKETFTTREEKITTEPITATITMKAETISDETSTSAEILRTAGKEVATESVEQPKLTTRMDEISSTAVQDREKTMTEAEATITAEAEDISTVTYDKESSTEPETPETSSEMSSPVSREEVNTTADLTKGPKAIDTTPSSHITTPYSTIADTETTTIQEEEDYLVDENTCIFEGRIYQSAEQIPRPDPCEFCFCFRGDIICLQQSCPPPLPNCQQTSIPGYCCPRYECPIYLASKNITQLSRRKGVNPIIIQKRIDKREIARPVVEVKGCQINGTFYEMGKTVTSASGPCLHCVCQEDGFLHCDPQRCKPQPPLMLKMNSNYFRR